MLRFEGVTKVFGPGLEVLRGVDLELGAGEFAFLVGRSGAGKSTLLRLVYREERPTAGRVWVAGRDVGTLAPREVPLLRRRVGVVFQDGRLLPDRTVWDNVAFPLVVTEAPTRPAFQQVADALRAVGLIQRAWKYPAALSGGERQRVAIARAIVADPLIVLADEPTGNLDPRSARQVMQILVDASRRGATVLVATHAHDLVESTGERVVALEDGRVAREWRRAPHPGAAPAEAPGTFGPFGPAAPFRPGAPAAPARPRVPAAPARPRPPAPPRAPARPGDGRPVFQRLAATAARRTARGWGALGRS